MGYSYQQMMQQPNLPQRGLNNKVLCNNGTYDITNGAVAPCSSAGGVKGQPVSKQLQTTEQIPAQVKKKSIISGNLSMLAKASIVPIGFYAFSKYKKYDNKKTAKVTIIGSVVVLGLVLLNGFSGAWTGTTIMDRTFGKQKYW